MQQQKNNKIIRASVNRRTLSAKARVFLLLIIYITILKFIS